MIGQSLRERRSLPIVTGDRERGAARHLKCPDRTVGRRGRLLALVHRDARNETTSGCNGYSGKNAYRDRRRQGKTSLWAIGSHCLDHRWATSVVGVTSARF